MHGKGKINIAVVGLEFGSEFIPIYAAHPAANMFAICQRTQAHLDKVGDAFGVRVRYTDYRELLKDPAIDAIHINTPPFLHAENVIAGLEAANMSPVRSPWLSLWKTAGKSSRQLKRRVRST